jgi:hypothetical protein
MFKWIFPTVFLLLHGTVVSARADAATDEAVKLFDRIFEEGKEGGSPEEAGEAQPALPAPGPQFPPALQKDLDLLADAEKSLREEYLKSVQNSREAFAQAVTAGMDQLPGPLQGVVAELADMALKGELPMGNIRYDLPRLQGEWDWQYNRYMMLLPHGRFRYGGKTSGRWEWLDYPRGIIAIHWSGGGCLMDVGEEGQDPAGLKSLWWGNQKVPRRKNKKGAVMDVQPPALPDHLKVKLEALVKFEKESIQYLQRKVKQERTRRLPGLINQINNAPIEVAREAAGTMARLQQPAYALPGASKPAGTWMWRDGLKLSIEPEGTVRLSDGKAGSWIWAGSSGQQFFITLPTRKVCLLVRFSKTDPDALRAIDDTGMKSDLVRTK